MTAARRLGIAALAAALAAGAVALAWHRRDEARLWRACGRLLARVEKRGPEGVIEAASRAREIGAAFTAEPRIAVPPYVDGERRREELAGMVLQVRAAVERLHLHVDHRSIEFSPDRHGATMRFRATAEAGVGRHVERDFRLVRIEWTWTDEGWRIAAVEAEEGLRRLPDPP